MQHMLDDFVRNTTVISFSAGAVVEKGARKKRRHFDLCIGRKLLEAVVAVGQKYINKLLFTEIVLKCFQGHPDTQHGKSGL